MHLLVDLSGIAYRAAYKLRLGSKERSTGVVYGVLRSLESLCATIEPHELVVCWDAGRVARTELLPEYKGQRKKDPQIEYALSEQLPLLAQVLECLPVVQVKEPGVEADDVIAVLAHHLRRKPVGIVTGDKDLYQLASAQRRHVLFTLDGVPAHLEFHPQQYLVYKVLVGDPSDNIKGVDGLGDVTCRKLLRRYHTLRRIMRAARKEGKLARMQYTAAKERVQRNLQLMRLDGSVLTAQQRTDIVATYAGAQAGVDHEGLRELFEELGFKSTLRRLDAFLTAFGGLGRKATSGEHAKTEADQEVAQAQAGKASAAARGGPRYRKLRKVKTARQDAPSQPAALRQAESSGAVVCSVVRHARESRARRHAAQLSRGAEIREETQPLGRSVALSLLSAFTTREGVRWLRGRSTQDLRLIKHTLDQLRAGEDVPAAALERVEQLHNDYITELPAWAK